MINTFTDKIYVMFNLTHQLSSYKHKLPLGYTLLHKDKNKKWKLVAFSCCLTEFIILSTAAWVKSLLIGRSLCKDHVSLVAGSVIWILSWYIIVTAFFLIKNTVSFLPWYLISTGEWWNQPVNFLIIEYKLYF